MEFFFLLFAGQICFIEFFFFNILFNFFSLKGGAINKNRYDGVFFPALRGNNSALLIFSAQCIFSLPRPLGRG